MPMYEYECEKCGLFEVMQKISEEPLTRHKECADSSCPGKIKRVMSSSSFHLVGTGWYKTDYASNKKDSSGASKGSSSSSESSTKEATPTKESSTKAASCAPGCGCH